MNLFWETRALTSAREDHLTCFIAAAIEIDGAFRRAYEDLVLSALSNEGRTPRVASVETQVQFAAQRSVPDMMLVLDDGRRVLCEHKIDAPETLQLTSDGKTVKQLERYLAIPDVAGLAYFRSTPVTLDESVLRHDNYLHPASAAHFVWRDLYAPLESGESDLARWLLAGFERLGFTPPVPHVGELWPGDTEEVRQNQANFGKLWQKTRGHVESDWTVRQDQRGCELYLRPRYSALASQVYISPIAQGGSLLRTRVDTDEAHLVKATDRLKTALGRLPAAPDLTVVRKPSGRTFIDLLAPLRSIFADAGSVDTQEDRLFSQVVPVVDALAVAGHKGTKRAAPEAVDRPHRAGSPAPDPHLGRLWPGDTEEVRENQRRVGRLWERTRQHLEGSWTIRNDQRGCELYLRPKRAALSGRVYVSPIAMGGTVLRTRVEIEEGSRAVMEQRIGAVAAQLPATPNVKVFAKSGRTYIDLLAPLQAILEGADSAEAQAQRLFDQVVPVVDLLVKV